jgi:tetratricopeptide (TPR) repeat protein
LLLAGRAAYRLEHFDEARRYLDLYQARYGQDDDLVLERVLLHATEGRVDDVVRFCDDRVGKNDPSAPLLLAALTQGNLGLFRVHEAETCLDRWQQRQPDDPQAAFYRGFLAEWRTRDREAVAHYRRVLELDPERDDARQHLARMLMGMAQPAEALPHLEYVRRRQPGNLPVAVNMAQCLDQLGRPDDAERLLDEVLVRAPDFAPALAERGRLALRADQVAAAETFLRRASERDPGDLQLHYQLAQALQRNGKAEEARAVQERSKQIEEDIKRMHELVSGRMDQAPHDPQLPYEAGMISLRAGLVQEALRWFERALREDPRHAPTHLALADYYQRVGEPGRAARHQALAHPVDDKLTR